MTHPSGQFALNPVNQVLKAPIAREGAAPVVSSERRSTLPRRVSEFNRAALAWALESRCRTGPKRRCSVRSLTSA